jgi:hypothetical protein
VLGGREVGMDKITTIGGEESQGTLALGTIFYLFFSKENVLVSSHVIKN